MEAAGCGKRSLLSTFVLTWLPEPPAFCSPANCGGVRTHASRPPASPVVQVRNQLMLRHSSRSLPLKLSDVALARLARLDVDQPLPLLCPADHVPRSEPDHCPNVFALAAVLGDRPFQHRVTRPEPSQFSASRATHSRVYASTTVRMRTIRPVASPSSTKSIAHSWFGPLSRGSTARSPAACVSSRTLKPSSR